jgi:hypothetical protein
VIAFAAALCGYEDYEETEEFGRMKRDFLKTFPGLPHGIPDEPAFRRVPRCLNPMELREGPGNRLVDVKLRRREEGAEARPVNIGCIMGTGKTLWLNTSSLIGYRFVSLYKLSSFRLYTTIGHPASKFF